ncbi:MAG: cytochrome C oxidase Cbb3 [Blastocatellia bacterium]|nr:MAG: cytochrome C oxidase Cbb3 [Blastocatellia bacterium]
MTCSLTVLLAAALATFSGAQEQQQNPQAPPPGMQVGTEFGFAVFQQRCMSCHGNPDAPLKAPEPAALRQLTPETILDALTTGVMKVQGQALSDAQRKQVAESLSGRPLGTASDGQAANMPNRCATNPPLTSPTSRQMWNGWGVDPGNTRFQPARAAGLTAEQLPQLKLKWAFGYPNGVSALSQPTVVSRRVFVGADTGYVYSLDATTGCVYWSFKTKAGVRSALSVGPLTGRGSAKYAAFVGDLLGNVYALNAHTGELLWTGHPEDHFTARVTGAPTLYNGRLYVPISSWEEFSAASLDYPCCTSRGSVAAFDVSSGRQLWKTYVVAEDPQPARKNSKGVQLWAPAGGSVWNSPTVDVQRGVIYFGTGDATTAPAAKTSDAVMALDMNSGKPLWSYQAFPNDSFLVGCDGPDKSENCPVVQGPDLDIPASPILRSLPGGRRVLLVATKPGDLIALDPDRNGTVIWKRNIGNAPNTDTKDGALAAFRQFAIMWGGAADTENAYFGLSGGSVAAVKLSTGEQIWMTKLAPEGKRVSYNAAVTVIPGVVFVGGNDGTLTALSTKDGHKLWQVETARDFDTVNKVKGKGGAISVPGATIVDGMLFIPSGYGIIGGNTGNVLLAFATK